jgi:hypothetical protein
MVGAAVPIATVDENTHFCTGKEDVDDNAEPGRPGYRPKAKTKAVNGRPEPQFGT